jgi:predicted N-acetyltransferase YhbS
VAEQAIVERAWELSTYRESDKPDMLALIREEYGEVDRAQEAYFDWLRLQSPREIPQHVIREKETGRVLISGTSVAVRAVWHGQEIPALLGFDIIVSRAYRRQGIHTTLAAQSREDLQQAGYRFVSIFPNQKSMPVLVRSDQHHHISRVPLIIRPLNARALAERYIGYPVLNWCVSAGWEVAGRTLWREWRPSQNGHSIQVVEDKELDEGYDDFWNEVKTKYEIMLVRDRTFLQWRFLDIPTREYQVLSARQENRILGYIVLRQADVRGTMAGLVADLLVQPGQQGDLAGLWLLHEALQRFKQAGLFLTGGLMLPHTQEYRIMRRAGYLDAPGQFAPQPFNLFVRSYSDQPPLSVLTQPESWHVTIADHDAV